MKQMKLPKNELKFLEYMKNYAKKISKSDISEDFKKDNDSLRKNLKSDAFKRRLSAIYDKKAEPDQNFSNRMINSAVKNNTYDFNGLYLSINTFLIKLNNENLESHISIEDMKLLETLNDKLQSNIHNGADCANRSYQKEITFIYSEFNNKNEIEKEKIENKLDLSSQSFIRENEIPTNKIALSFEESDSFITASQERFLEKIYPEYKARKNQVKKDKIPFSEMKEGDFILCDYDSKGLRIKIKLEFLYQAKNSETQVFKQLDFKYQTIGKEDFNNFSKRYPAGFTLTKYSIHGLDKLTKEQVKADKTPNKVTQILRKFKF
jgi:hypothetical protein